MSPFVSMSPFICLGLALSTTIHGASLALPANGPETSYTSPFESSGLSVMNQVSLTNYDMSDLTGLTSGQAIEVSITLNEAATWAGGFSADAGDMTLNLLAKLELSLGAASTSLFQSYSIGPVSGPFDSVVGYALLSGPLQISLVVPWGSDLSNIGVTLTDQSEIIGNNAYFKASNLSNLGIVTLTTTSVPEPTTSILLSLGLISWASIRRRRA